MSGPVGQQPARLAAIRSTRRLTSSRPSITVVLRHRGVEDDFVAWGQVLEMGQQHVELSRDSVGDAAIFGYRVRHPLRRFDFVCPGWDVEHRLGYRCQRGCFLGGEHHGWAHPRGAVDAHPRGLPTPVLGTFPAIIDVSELFSGIEIRPHILNAAIHPRLIRLFGNERAAVVGGYPRLGSCR